MRLDDAPAWLQNLVADQALGFLEAESNGETVRVESVDADSAVIRVDGYTYRASRADWWIT